jgi:hypothetical protein
MGKPISITHCRSILPIARFVCHCRLPIARLPMNLPGCERRVGYKSSGYLAGQPRDAGFTLSADTQFRF